MGKSTLIDTDGLPPALEKKSSSSPHPSLPWFLSTGAFEERWEAKGLGAVPNTAQVLHTC